MQDLLAGQVDTDGDCKLNFEEFSELFTLRYGSAGGAAQRAVTPISSKELRMRFDMLDADGSGQVSSVEMEMECDAVGIRDGMRGGKRGGARDDTVAGVQCNVFEGYVDVLGRMFASD